MRKMVSQPPTERELRLAAEWTRVARLISASIQARMNLDEQETNDPLIRYAPLKVLLNDDLILELEALGEIQSASDLRRRQRAKFASLLTRLQSEVRLRHIERIAQMDAFGSWSAYAELFREAWLIRAVLARLHVALLLYSASMPGSVRIVRAAWPGLQRMLAPAHVVPIRP